MRNRGRGMTERRVLERTLSSGATVRLEVEPVPQGLVRIVRLERRGRGERGFVHKPEWEGRVERLEALLPGGSFFALRVVDSE